MFKTLWKQGWFNPHLDLDLTIEDINIDELIEKRHQVIHKDERRYVVSIPEYADLKNLKDSDVDIFENPI